MSEDDERNAFEDIYSQLAEFRQRLEELEQLAESKVVKAPKAAPKPAERGYVAPKIRPDSIARVRDGDKELTLDVQVETIGQVYSGTSSTTGNPWTNCRVLVSDESAQIYLVLWGDQIEFANTLRPHDHVTLHNVYARMSKKNVLELQLDRQGSIVPREEFQL